MGQVVEIHQKRFFTIDDARELLPVIRRLTRDVNMRVTRLSTQLSYVNDSVKRSELEDLIQDLFREWHEKVRKLGCEAKGMWLVDFDTGEGYFCWHYPEPEVSHFHGYFEGFRGRVKIN